jgi:hypothetical protein
MADETISAEELARDLRGQLEAGRSYHDDGKWLAVWGEVIAKALLRLAEVERQRDASDAVIAHYEEGFCPGEDCALEKDIAAAIKRHRSRPAPQEGRQE